MTLPDFFLGCFVFGLLWSAATFLLGGLHLPAHHGHAHLHAHQFHHLNGKGAHGPRSSWSHYFLSAHTLAIFLAWMGGCGYLLIRHATLSLLLVLIISITVGIAGAAALASFLRLLSSRDFTLDAADHDLIGTLGRISAPIRAGGTGEMIFTHDGARRSVFVRSENGSALDRHHEVVITDYRNGIAYVRTWDALTAEPLPHHLANPPGAAAEDAPSAHP